MSLLSMLKLCSFNTDLILLSLSFVKYSVQGLSFVLIQYWVTALLSEHVSLLPLPENYIFHHKGALAHLKIILRSTYICGNN